MPEHEGGWDPDSDKDPAHEIARAMGRLVDGLPIPHVGSVRITVTIGEPAILGGGASWSHVLEGFQEDQAWQLLNQVRNFTLTRARELARIQRPPATSGEPGQADRPADR